MTKLSDDTDRRLTALAGYDSLVQCHCPSASSAPERCTSPDSCSTPSTSWTFDLPVRFLGRERQLERRALHVIDEDVQVVGIDERVLGRGVEEERRVPHHELIDRRARRHHHRRRLPGAAAGAAGALPRRGNRAGIAGHHAHVERADVDAELERVGRDHAAHLPGAQALLDLAPAQRQIAAAIAADALRHARARPRSPPSDTSSGSRSSVRLCANTITCRLRRRNSPATRRDSARYERRMPSSRLTTGGLTNTKNFSPRGAPLLLDQRERPLGQPLGQLARDWRWSPTSR